MIADGWRERLEAGARRLSAAQRVTLLERLVIAHERYDEISFLWRAEAARRMVEIREGRMELIDAELVMAELEAVEASTEQSAAPANPETVEEIEDEALYLMYDEFYLLLTNIESALPDEVDPAWRVDIQRRITAIPAEVERRYRECNGGLPDDEG
jgi:hypothetical protein